MASIFELTVKGARLYEMLLDDEIDQQTVNNTLEAMGADEELEEYAKIIRQLELDNESCQAEKKRLTDKQRQIENAAGRVERSIIAFMQAVGKNKTQAGTFEIKLTTGKPCEIVNEELLDEKYFKPQPPKIDKAAIRAALLAGEEVPGAVLTTSTGVRIR